MCFKPQAKLNEGNILLELVATPILTIGVVDGPRGIAVNHRGEVKLADTVYLCSVLVGRNSDRLACMALFLDS